MHGTAHVSAVLNFAFPRKKQCPSVIKGCLLFVHNFAKKSLEARAALCFVDESTFQTSRDEEPSLRGLLQGGSSAKFLIDEECSRKESNLHLPV